MGIPTLISTHTASDSSSIDITSGIDSTYDEYMFVFTDINPATNSANFEFQVNAAGASGYNETMTTTYVEAYHAEADNSNGVVYKTSGDQAQGTAYQRLARATGNGADECSAGILHLFSPSNTTYVTHFYSRLSVHKNEPVVLDCYVAGYINITAAVDEISFKMSSGNFDCVIQMYGIA